MARYVVLISGRGSNLVAMHAAMQRQGWPHQLAAVISNRADAAGLAHARGWGVPTQVLEHQRFASRAAFDAELAQQVAAYAPDLVVLAGFMRILGTHFLQRFANRVVNIHPALLPAFTGLDTHARALQAGVRLHGTTTHLVTDVLDAGPILMQAALAVHADDTAASLAARVLKLEHQIYPKTVCALLDGDLWLDQGRVLYRSGFQPYLWDESVAAKTST